MADEATERLLDFFDYQWGDTVGQVYLATLEKGGEFTQYMLEWPRSRQALPKFILAQSAEGKDPYYCPALFVPFDKTVEFNHKGKTAATRANILGSRSLWVDFDNGAAPEDWSTFAKEKGIPEPSLIVQSSVKGNQHAYWHTEFQTSIDEVEQYNRSLALTVGADRSGWDGNQLLRPPYTTNFGYKGDGTHKSWYRGNPATTSILGRVNPDSIGIDQFSNLGSAEREILDSLQLAGNVPKIESVLAFGKWSTELFEQFSMDKQEASDSSPDKRSGAIQKLAYLAAESGMSDDQIYSIIAYADKRWEKYATRSPAIRHKLLTDIIARARVKVGYLTDDMLTFAGLLGNSTDELTETPKIIYDWDDFMTTDIHVDWLIEGLLSNTGYAILTGQPGVGKTQVGMQIGIELALGHSNILGWHVPGGPRKGIMFSLEMDHAPLKVFAEKIQGQYPGMEREIGRNFKVVPLGNSVDLLKVEGQNFFDSLLSEYQPDFIFIDSLKKVMTKSLNDDDAIRQMNDVIQRIRQKHKCAVFVIHHDRKKQNGGKHDSVDLSDMYGSQYIAAEADSVLAFRKTSTKGHIVMDPLKVRLAAEPFPSMLIRNEHLQFTVSEEFSGDEGDNLRIIGDASGKNSNSDENGPGFRS